MAKILVEVGVDENQMEPNLANNIHVLIIHTSILLPFPFVGYGIVLMEDVFSFAIQLSLQNVFDNYVKEFLLHATTTNNDLSDRCI